MKLVLEYKLGEGGHGIARLTIPDVSLPMDEYVRRLSIFTGALNLFNEEFKKKGITCERRIEE